MSCFETSTFIKDPKFFSQLAFIEAVKKMGWKYQLIKNEVIVPEIPGVNLRGEFAMKVSNNGKLVYNSYYLKNGEELVDELKEVFFKLNVKYSKRAVLSEFKKVGFTLKEHYNFVPNANEVESFSVIGYTKDKRESEKKTEIFFKILHDGTVISDSNYIPEDLHKLADKAFEGIDKCLGNKRREGIEIKRKKIPVKYQNKAYCTVNNKIRAKN